MPIVMDLSTTADKVLATAHATEIGRISVMDVVRFVVVAIYLFLVLLLLLVSRRIGIGFNVRGLIRQLRARFRRPIIGVRDLPPGTAVPR